VWRRLVARIPAARHVWPLLGVIAASVTLFASVSGSPTTTNASANATATADPLAVDLTAAGPNGDGDPSADELAVDDCMYVAPYSQAFPGVQDVAGWAQHVYLDAPGTAHGPVTVYDAATATFTVLGEWSCTVDTSQVAHFTFRAYPTPIAIGPHSPYATGTADPRGLEH
jgi:hypothetical protein